MRRNRGVPRRGLQDKQEGPMVRVVGKWKDPHVIQPVGKGAGHCEVVDHGASIILDAGEVSCYIAKRSTV